MTIRQWTIGGGLAVLLALSPLVSAPVRADADDAPQWIPTGQHITPEAATGALFQTLDPGLKDFPDFRVGMAVTTAVSHDARRC